MRQNALEIGSIIDGLALPEPLQVVFVQPVGNSFKVGGKDSHFWRLAQALSALYPAASQEKQWVESVLARKKGLGL